LIESEALVSIEARVLIIARDDTLAGPLAEGLDRLGWRTVTARGPYAALAALADLQIEAVILDLASAGEEPAILAKRLRTAAEPRRVPIVAVGEPDAKAKAAFDLTLTEPLHPAQAALRLESLVRMAVAEEEFELRRQTFAERGRLLEPPETSGGPYRILAVGEPAPQFLALSNALVRGGAEVVGSFTAYTAFDYLHERNFDSVVLWAGENQAEALSIAAGMRRNTRLYHIPTMLYLAQDSYVGVTEAFHRGVTDVAGPQSAEADTALRVLELARCYRRQTAIRQALEKARTSGLMDVTTGLFTRDLFAAHLARLAQAARQRKRPLSVCVLRVADKPELAEVRAGGWLDRAMPQIGSMIGRLIRVEDTAAKLGNDVFALALPATLGHAARSAADRIAAVIGCTAFDAGEGKRPFVVEFDVGIAAVESGENPATALERAAAKSMERRAS
jgi:two-component system cell cycle response regulator PopA